MPAAVETVPVDAMADSSALSPAAMARHLSRIDGDAALCFATAMRDGAAWANEEWGDYWAKVMRLV